MPIPDLWTHGGGSIDPGAAFLGGLGIRAAVYARVSSSRQEQERTIASQVETIEAYAARQGSNAWAPRCHLPMLRAKELDELVWSEVTQVLCDPHALQRAVVGGAPVSADSALLAAQRSTLERPLHAAEQERQRLVDADQAGLLGLPQLEPRLAGLRLREQQWQQKRDQLDRAQQHAAAAQQLLDRLELPFCLAITWHGGDLS